jgi:hypothetical protein
MHVYAITAHAQMHGCHGAPERYAGARTTMRPICMITQLDRCGARAMPKHTSTQQHAMHILHAWHELRQQLAMQHSRTRGAHLACSVPLSPHTPLSASARHTCLQRLRSCGVSLCGVYTHLTQPLITCICMQCSGSTCHGLNHNHNNQRTQAHRPTAHTSTLKWGRCG